MLQKYFTLLFPEKLLFFLNNLSPRNVNTKILRPLLRFPRYFLFNYFSKRIRRLINSALTVQLTWTITGRY